MKNTIIKRTAISGGRALAGAAVITAWVVLTATPVRAESTEHHKFQTLCDAGGGYFALARFGTYRCQDANTDGMGVFWAERAACERSAGRSFIEAIDESGTRGTWLCAPFLT